MVVKKKKKKERKRYYTLVKMLIAQVSNLYTIH